MLPARAPKANRFRGKNSERDPDETESNQVRACEGFVIEKNAEKKSAGGSEILEEADRGQAEMARGVSEPDERQTGDHAGADQDGRGRPMLGSKEKGAVVFQSEEIENCDGEEEDGFGKQTGDRGRAGEFAQECVEAPRSAERERDPGEATVAERKICDGPDREQDGGELKTRQAFTQEKRTEEHVHERRHEVAEAGFEDATRVDRPDEGEPVERDGGPAREAEEQCAA